MPGFSSRNSKGSSGLSLLQGAVGERPAPTGRTSETCATAARGRHSPYSAAELVTEADVTGSRGGRWTQKQLCVALEAPHPRPDKAAGFWGERGSAPRRRGREGLDPGPGTSPPYTCQWPQATGFLMLAGDERLWWRVGRNARFLGLSSDPVPQAIPAVSAMGYNRQEQDPAPSPNPCLSF